MLLSIYNICLYPFLRYLTLLLYFILMSFQSLFTSPICYSAILLFVILLSFCSLFCCLCVRYSAIILSVTLLSFCPLFLMPIGQLFWEPSVFDTDIPLSVLLLSFSTFCLDSYPSVGYFTVSYWQLFCYPSVPCSAVLLSFVLFSFWPLFCCFLSVIPLILWFFCQ
jgi:hypothetical protein